MPANPERASRGGDVPGETKIDVQWAVGSAISVADASYEPGYELGHSLAASDWNMSPADIKQGYCSYGVGIGDGRPRDMIGGKRK